MEPSYSCEVFCNVYGGNARFNIGISQSDCATAVQASVIDLIEYIYK